MFKHCLSLVFVIVGRKPCPPSVPGVRLFKNFQVISSENWLNAVDGKRCTRNDGIQATEATPSTS